MSPKPLQLAWLAGLAIALLSPISSANAQAMHRSPHAEETKNIVGVKGALVNQFAEGEFFLGGSVIPFYERNVIHGWLEIEAALALTWIAEETIVGFELFAKKPFHVNEVVNPYVAFGPNVSIIIGPEETKTRFALLWSAGSYFWLGDSHWGLDLELTYLLVFDSFLVHELAVEIGPVFRF